MALGRIGDIISAAARWTAAPQSPAVIYESPSSSSSQESSNANAVGFPYKNSLRLSSSLQDFSTFRRVDPEDPAIDGTHQNHHLHSSSSSSFSFQGQGQTQSQTSSSPSFSKDKDKAQHSPSSRKKWRWLRSLLLLFCLLLFAFVIIYLASLYQFSSYSWSGGGGSSTRFYVVLDCGSTGTRVYLYEASIRQTQDNTLPILIKSLTDDPRTRKPPNSLTGRAYQRMETEPGLHKLVHNISGLKSAINPLVSWAEKQIPQYAHKSTSIFLYATAGVRRLPNEDSKWILDNSWSILKNSPFYCRREWVKIISGMEEAYFGWIALNHGKGMLGAKPRLPTYGALDLGGSSLQITFESDKHAKDETSLDLRIGSVKHHLTAYSLSGYGLNDAFDKSVAHLFRQLSQQALSGKIELKHPCLHLGYKEQYTCSQCVSKNQQGASPVNGEKTGGKGANLGISVRLIGASDWLKCSKLAKVAVNISEWSNVNAGIDCDLQPCALPDGFPPPYGQFYAMSGFYVVYRFFNLTPDATLDDVLEKGREFCEKTWEVAKNSVTPQPFIEQYCFRAPYVVSLLREGLHIIDKQITIGSGSITWTLGVALLEAGKGLSNRMGIHNYEILQMKINPLFLIVILCISLLFLICALSCVGNLMPKFFRRPYLPLFRHNSASSAAVLSIPSPFLFPRWSPINSGDGRVKMPLSPTIAGAQQRPFGLAHGLGSNSGIQLMESSMYPSTSSVTHSYSSSNLGQMQFDSSMASFWVPHRSQMRLQSRRSQSREDLNCSLVEAHSAKV